MEEQNAYILGTDTKELHRLGYQHQIWSSEARRAWEIAEFCYGQDILELGSGPGFCSVELGYLVGETGSVTAVDKSRAYINYLVRLKDLYSLNIDAVCSTYDDLELEDNSFDGAYCRWSLAWISNPAEIINKVAKSLKSGAAFAAQEYFDWSTFQTEPSYPELDKGIKNILRSFKEQEGDIDVGRRLASMFYDAGLEVISTRPLTKYAQPDEMNWYWPKTFLHIYMPKLVGMGYMTEGEVEDALAAFEQLEYETAANLFCPSMIEVVAVKP